MHIDPNMYTHDSDRAALQALKAIPGFAALLKSFMMDWNEQQMHLQNMATNLRVSEKQLPRYYNMLLPICEKLGIDVPELYITQDVVPNAYTYGDKNPYIVMTTGLLEAMPEALIPTVLAHECGHIACHHVLYRTMGSMILNGAFSFLGLGSLITKPISVAFYYWMRCSELSADRAAAICSGGSDRVVEMCMRFAGYDKDIIGTASTDAFLEQAREYKRLVDDSALNKTFEFLMFNSSTHPLNAVRALESVEWTKTDSFRSILAHLGGSPAPDGVRRIPLTSPLKDLAGRDRTYVDDLLRSLGFTNIRYKRTTEKARGVKPGFVVCVTGADGKPLRENEWYDANLPILVHYYLPKTEEEIAAEHPGQCRPPHSAWQYLNDDHESVIRELEAAGFTGIRTRQQLETKAGFLQRDGGVVSISIGGRERFDKDDWFPADADILIVYRVILA